MSCVSPSRTMLNYCWTWNMQAEGRHTAGRATAQSPEKRNLHLCELQMSCVSPSRNMLNYSWTCTMQAEGRNTAGHAKSNSPAMQAARRPNALTSEDVILVRLPSWPESCPTQVSDVSLPGGGRPRGRSETVHSKSSRFSPETLGSLQLFQTSYVSSLKKDPGPLVLFRQTAPGGEPPNHFMGAALPLRGWPG